MNRKEFLEILRSQLAGQMQEGKAAAHIRYYEDYIQSQVRGGRSEQEVLQELGDPHLIAKTLIDTDDEIELNKEIDFLSTNLEHYTIPKGVEVYEIKRMIKNCFTYFNIFHQTKIKLRFISISL